MASTNTSMIPASVTNSQEQSDQLNIIFAEFLEKEVRLREACRQIDLLSQRVKATSVRYERANQCGNKAFRISLRFQLATLEGMQTVYFKYAAKQENMLQVIGENFAFAMNANVNGS
jgi:hypothetical protein